MDIGDANSATKPPIGRRMKPRAPPPPPAPQPAPRRIFRNAVPDGGGMVGGDTKENMLRPTVELHITLPEGFQTTSTVDGRKALMDLLVDLCGQYHLNPAYHTLELLSSEGRHIAFKPNALLGSLDVACVLIKGRVAEEKVVRKPPPKVPEKTVRLVVNYHRSQKAVVRVNPLVPLESLVPAICEKCEFDPGHVLLLKDNVSNHELELDKSLTELGIRELYLLDQALESLRSNSLSAAEKKGLLGFFKFNKRKAKTEEQSSLDMDELDDNVIQNADNYSNGMSVVAGRPCVEARPSTLGQSQSVMNISRMSPKVELKKRRAPAPPPPSHTPSTMLAQRVAPGSPRSDSQLKKRKAPAPPPTPVTSTPADDATSQHSHSTEDSEPVGSLCSNSSSDMAVESASSSMADEHGPEGELAASSTPDEMAPSTTPEELVASTMPEPAPRIAARQEPVPTTMLKQEVSPTTTPKKEVAPSTTPRQEVGPTTTPKKEAVPSTTPRQEVVPTTTPKQEVAPTTTPKKEAVPSTTPKQEVVPTTTPKQEVAPTTTPKKEAAPSTTSEETESELNFKLEEMENNRHSAIGSERQVPLKPQRSPLREPPPSPSSPPPPTEQDVEVAPQSWLHSARAEEECVSERTADLETLSVGSSSSSFQDQGYAASEGMADDPGLLSLVGSPTDLTPPARPPGPPKNDSSSDSDEGCATWGSRHSREICRGDQSGRRQDSYEEDPELTAQLHLTLADLDADLAGVNHSDGAPLCVDDEIPVSVVDLVVPVTTIDEVPECHGDSTSDYETALLRNSTSDVAGKDQTAGSQPSRDFQNENNDACTSDGRSKASAGLTPAEKKLPASKVQKEKAAPNPESKAKAEPQRLQVQREAAAIERPRGPVVRPAVPRALSIPEGRPKPPPASRSQSAKTSSVSSARGPPAQSKITQSAVTRFGMKTFTVVPPKPAVYHTHTPAASIITGAIKIDEQGNMVNQRQGTAAALDKEDLRASEAESAEEAPLLGKAKAFWSSTEKKDGPAGAGRAAVVKAREAEAPKPSPATAKPRSEDTRSGPAGVADDPPTVAGGKPPVPLPVEQPSSIARFPEQRRDLSFLKPSRRTSSQYMASAIAKYTGMPAAKADGVPELPESTVSKQHPPGSQGFKHEVRSMHAGLSHKDAHAPTHASRPKESISMPYLAGPKRSLSYPSHVAEISKSKQANGEGGGRLFGGASTKSLDSNSAGSKPQSTAQTPTCPQPSPASPKQGPSLRTSLQDLPPAPSPANATRPPLARKPEPPGPWVLPEPNQVTVFGPIKKFKPVIFKSIQRETTLHSSLMDAIQSGDGKERLKKIADSSKESALKKPPYIEEETHHSALLSAIRAPSNSARLRKTKSEASEELHLLRTEVDGPVQSDSSHPAPAAAPVFAPAPPPPPSPPVQPKPPVVLAAGGNPEFARESLLEAIRSGSGAEGLRKVPVAKKTVQVNGRLSMFQARSSFSQGH